MKNNNSALNIVIFIIIGLIVVMGIIFLIPEKSSTPTNNVPKQDDIIITFTTTDTDITLNKGETKEINYSLSGNYNINWFSSNSSVATVSNGVVTAIGKGICNITGTVSAEGKIRTISVRVTVNEEEKEQEPEKPTVPQIEKLVISANKINVVVEETKKIEYRIEPTNGEIRSIKWDSEDPSIATIDENGNVKGIKEGSTVVSLNINDNLIGKITVKVKPKITGITLSSPTSLTLKVGGTSQITAVTNPKDSNVKITYKSNNSHVTVNDSGKITAVSSGTSTITVAADKYSKKISVTVRPQTGVISGDGIWAYTDSNTVNPVRAGTNFFSNLEKKGIGKLSGTVYTYSDYAYDFSKSLLSHGGRSSMVRIYYPNGKDLSKVNTFTFIGGAGERNWGSFFSAIEKDTSMIKTGGIVILVSGRSGYNYQDAINATNFIKAIVKQEKGMKNSVAGYSMGGPEAGKAAHIGNYDRLVIVDSYIDSSDIASLQNKEIYFYSPNGDSMAKHTTTTLNRIASNGNFKNVTLVTNNSNFINNYSKSMLVVNPGSAQGYGHGYTCIVKSNMFAFINKD